MSRNFIDDLQHDLVAALERYDRRGAPRRLAANLVQVLPRRAAVAVITAVAAAVVAIAVTAHEFTREAPAARPRIVATVRVGGTPVGAVLSGGSLWVTDFRGSLLQVDPRRRRVTARIAVPGSSGPIAADSTSLWVQAATTGCDGVLMRIDPDTRRIEARTPMPYPTEQHGALAAAGDGGAWVKPDAWCSGHRAIERVDAAGVVTARIGLANVDGLAAAAGSLWALHHDGTLTQLDAASGRVRRRWPRLAPLSLADSTSWNAKALVADGAGAWVLSTRHSAIYHVGHGRVVDRIAVPVAAQPLLVNAGDGLWIATGDRLGRDYRLVRLDAKTGHVTANLDLGIHRPVALIPATNELYVLTGDGFVQVVRA
jgi:hypothetical protein